jgi:AraC-like DNA-binding protein
MLPSTLSSWALLVAKALEARGHDPRAVFASVGLDAAKLRDPNARYPVSGMRRLWDACESLIDDPCLGLRVIEHWHPTTFHALGYAWLASETLHEAFDRLARYLHIVSTGVNGEVAVEADRVWVRMLLSDRLGEMSPSPAAGLAGVASLVRLCRLSVGDDFAPVDVNLGETGERPCKELDAYFGCTVRFDEDEAAGMAVRRIDADRELSTANADLAHANDRVIQSYLARLADASVSARVQGYLIDLLPGGHISEQQVAKHLSMSVRTMQRRLSEEGTSFKALVDATRRDLAKHYLSDPSYSISEITFLLGFSETSNFTRAFRRWHGRPPIAVRRELLAGQAAH